MFSKYLKPAIIIIFSLQIGCGLKLGEKAKEPEVVTFNGASCIKGSVDNFKKFVAGDATDDEIGSAVECLQTAIKAFKENVRGADHNKYTPEEVVNFIVKKFLKSEAEIPQEIVTDLKFVKYLLAGGDPRFITRPELDSISSVLGRLKPELVRLNPHIKVYLSKWQPAAGEDKAAQLAKFEAARNALKTSLNRVGQLLAATQRGAEVTDLLKAAADLSKLSPAPAAAAPGSSIQDTLAKAEPLIIKIKTNLIGGTTVVKGTEWIKLLDLAAEGLAQSLRIKYFLTPLTPEQNSERLDVYQAIASDVSKLIPEILRGRTDSISNVQIAEILQAAAPLLPQLANATPELVDQFGKVKLVVLGNVGTTYSAWNISDFNKLNAMIPEFFDIAKTSLASLKYYKIDLLGYRNGSLKKEDFLKAEANLNQAIQRLGEKILHSYDLNDLKQLLLGLKAVVGESIQLPANLEEWFKLFYAGKVALTGEPGPQLTVKNIQLLLNVGVRLFGNAVEFSNFVSPFKTDEPEMTNNLAPWISKFKESLLLELTLKSSHQITTAEITNLVLAAQDAKIIKTNIQKESLELALDAVWKNVLTKPEDRLGAKGSIAAFNEEALTNLATEIVLWTENQRVIFQLFANKAEYTKDEMVDALRSRVADGAKMSPPARLSMIELHKVVSARGNMNFNALGYLKILANDSGMYHLRDLTASNLAKTAARVITRSFSNDLGRISDYAGVTQAEAQAGFDQFKFLLFDLAILDRADVGFIASRFTESNLFLSVSNGDDYSSFEELHHIILHIQSGLARAAAMQERMITACVRERAPILIKSVLNQNCLMDFFLGENDAFLDLPEFLKLKAEQKFTPEANKKYYLSLLLAAGYIPNEAVPEPERTVELGKAGLFPHVVQYIEMMFATHEADHSNTLEKQEALGAFPIFKNLLAFVTKDIKQVLPEDLPGVFIYLIKYKKKPVSLGDKLKFITFVKDKEQKDWEIHSTRHDLGDVFTF
ncbi:MAG: hypothetical protein K0R29_2580, partial [Pseudobdellovibrio sp.]|nr:hypothetical protein [Pseudobdellovibrio sp.]